MLYRRFTAVFRTENDRQLRFGGVGKAHGEGVRVHVPSGVVR